MSSEKIGIENTLIQLTMVLKLQQLKRGGLPSLTYDNLEDYISGKLWLKQAPDSLHTAADEILSIEPEEIIRFLSRQAIVEGSAKKLEDFSDIIGG
ncbi:MAG: hypothetical protein IJM63_09670 [Solobacterium sp.]|nr:hypothetical protein [Solobacterium sp.]MBQ9824752.1 hypothetical protein [Solobacterium sp.]